MNYADRTAEMCEQRVGRDYQIQTVWTRNGIACLIGKCTELYPELVAAMVREAEHE